MVRKYFAIFLITFLLAISVFFRLWRIDKAPISLFGDEIDVGLQAYSILTTGKDYMGTKLPIMFHSFSEYRLPMQLYEAVPFIKLFGLNEFGVRGPAVVSGFISLIIVYFLVKELFKDQNLALIASILISFSPWHFNFSRQANDAGILLPFILAGTLFFVKGVKNYKYLFISALFFALSIYTYAIATVFTPLFVLSLIVIYRKEIFEINFIKLIEIFLVGFIILIPFILFTISGISSRRFSSISIASGNTAFAEVVSKRQWSNSLLTRALYNTKSVTIDAFTKSYIQSLSSTFLFTQGDPNMRQGIEGFGELYYFDFIFILAGLGFALFSDYKNKKSYLTLFAWLLLSPIPSDLTKDGANHASRLILMLVPLIIFSSLGLWIIIKKLVSKRGLMYKIVLSAIVIFIVFDWVKFLHRYFVIWPNESWRYWQTGFKETMNYVKENESKYDRVYFNNTYEPSLPRFLFYYKYDMALFQKQFTGDVHVENIAPQFNGFKLGDKYYFGEIVKPVERLGDEKSLVVASGEKDITNPEIFNENSNLRILEVFSSPTNIPIFYIYKKNKI